MSYAYPLVIPSNTSAERSGPASDTILIAATATGDKLALRTLYARHHVQVYRFLLRLVHKEAVAEDLVADVFLDVWRKADRFAGRSQVSTWLLAIARHKALSALRRPVTEVLGDDAAERIEDPADNAEAALGRRETQLALRNSLEDLSPAHREIVDLVYYHGRTIEEAATIIGVPLGTAKTRMFYARKQLRSAMAARGEATLATSH
jgi:RNA polymerase sigma-70 factor (ECF subfamily)